MRTLEQRMQRHQRWFELFSAARAVGKLVTTRCRSCGTRIVVRKKVAEHAYCGRFCRSYNRLTLSYPKGGCRL